MRKSVQRYVWEIITDRRKGSFVKFVQCVLWALSHLYHLGVFIRLCLYDLGIFRRRPLGCLTISVGNITVGGTGKTPVVEMLAKALAEGGRKVAVLSRGYKSRLPRRREDLNGVEEYSPGVVSDGQHVLLDALQAGDEPYLLARNLPGVIVLVDKNRVRAGEYAIARMGADTLILDDGFQYLPLGRRLDFVLVDCTDPFGNGHLLPRGILREPVSGLRRAHYFFLTKSAGVQLNLIRERLGAINPKAEIIETVHHPLFCEEIGSGTREPPAFVQGKKVHIFSGIARPESFEAAIQGLGGKISKSIRFLDHHRFTPEEIRRIVAEASADGADCILTTQKDAVRVPAFGEAAVPIYFLRVAVRITRGATDFADCVSRICYA